MRLYDHPASANCMKCRVLPGERLARARPPDPVVVVTRRGDLGPPDHGAVVTRRAPTGTS